MSETHLLPSRVGAGLSQPLPTPGPTEGTAPEAT